MGWVEDLRGKTVGLDTAPLVFYIEDHPTYAELLALFFEAVKSAITRNKIGVPNVLYSKKHSPW